MSDTPNTIMETLQNTVQSALETAQGAVEGAMEAAQEGAADLMAKVTDLRDGDAGDMDDETTEDDAEEVNLADHSEDASVEKATA